MWLCIFRCLIVFIFTFFCHCDGSMSTPHSADSFCEWFSHWFYLHAHFYIHFFFSLARFVLLTNNNNIKKTLQKTFCRCFNFLFTCSFTSLLLWINVRVQNLHVLMPIFIHLKIHSVVDDVFFLFCQNVTLLTIFVWFRCFTTFFDVKK